MEIGEIFEKDGVEYCISDVKQYGNHNYAYAISGEGEDAKLTFFQLVEDGNGGVLLNRILDEKILVEIMPIFLDDIEEN